MKNKQFLLPFVLLCFFIVFLFSRFITIGNVTYSVLNAIFNIKFTFFSIFLIILIIIPIISFALILKNKNYLVCSFLLLIEGIGFIFNPVIADAALSIKKSSLEFASYLYIIYFFFLSLLTYSMYERKEKYSTREIVEIGLLIAFAVVLDFKIFKIPVQANGGSISLSMLPLIVIALRFGVIKGFIASGLIYGFITCAIDGYGFIYFPFDYLLGFGSLCIFGVLKDKIFKNRYIKDVFLILICLIIAFVLRTLSSTISGIVFYKLNFVSSLIYQLTYLPLSFVACFVVLVLLYKPICYIQRRFLKFN